MHIAAAAARACRNPSKTIGFSSFSASYVNKTYENIRLSHPKIFKNLPARSCGIFKKPMVFQHSCQSGLRGPLSRARRTNSTTSARSPEAPSVSNNTMRRTCARPPRAHGEILSKPLVFQPLVSHITSAWEHTYTFTLTHTQTNIHTDIHTCVYEKIEKSCTKPASQ